MICNMSQVGSRVTRIAGVGLDLEQWSRYSLQNTNSLKSLSLKILPPLSSHLFSRLQPAVTQLYHPLPQIASPPSHGFSLRYLWGLHPLHLQAEPLALHSLPGQGSPLHPQKYICHFAKQKASPLEMQHWRTGRLCNFCFSSAPTPPTFSSSQALKWKSSS